MSLKSLSKSTSSVMAAAGGRGGIMCSGGGEGLDWIPDS